MDFLLNLLKTNEIWKTRLNKRKKIYKATLEAVNSESCELEYDLATVLNGISLTVATLFAKFNEDGGDFTIDVMAEGFKILVVRSYNAIQRVE